jgi:hypothetical protein
MAAFSTSRTDVWVDKSLFAEFLTASSAQKPALPCIRSLQNGFGDAQLNAREYCSRCGKKYEDREKNKKGRGKEERRN